MWEVEGCLIACWLALREEVEEVMYKPGEKTYLVKRDGVENLLDKFLRDVDTGLDE